MTKKWLYRSAFRSIQKQKITYFSIVLILIIGIGVFEGAVFGAKRHEDSYSNYCDEVNYRDIEVISPILISEEDISQITSLEGVQEAEGGYRVSAIAHSDNKEQRVRVISNNLSFDTPTLVEGTMPWSDNECVIEKSLADAIGLKISDTIKLTDDGGFNIESIYDDSYQGAGFLRYESYEITGIVEHPDHVNTKYTTVPYVMINKGGFDTELLNESYMSVLIRVEGVQNTDRFSSSYVDKVSDVADAIGKLSDEIYPGQYEKLKSIYDGYLKKYSSYLDEHKETKEKMLAHMKLLEQHEDDGLIITSLYDNISYITAHYNASVIRSLVPCYMGAFMFMALLIMGISINKMLQEDKPIIADMMTNGFTDREIYMPYFVYGISAALIGALCGIVLGVCFVERVIIVEFAKSYAISTPGVAVYPLYALIFTAIVCLAAFAEISAVIRKIKGYNILDMLRKDEVKKLTIKAKKRHYSLNRIIFRNMFLEKHRVIISIVASAAAMMLVIISFTIRYSVAQTINYQKDEIISFDGYISYDASTEQTLKDIESKLNDEGVSYIRTKVDYISIKGKNLSLPSELNVLDLNLAKKYISIRDKNNRTIKNVDGIVINERIADYLSIDKGDYIQLINESGNIYSVKVAKVFTSYIGVETYMTPSYYEKVFENSYEPDNLMVRFNGSDSQKVIDGIKNVSGYRGFKDADKNLDYFRGFFKSFNYIIFVITGFAIAMASVVVIVLVDMQMSEKQTEIDVMHINGFAPGEIRRYLGLETVFTCIAGIVCGIIAGIHLSKYIIHQTRGIFAEFSDAIEPAAIIIPIIIISIFYIIIYKIVYAVKI